MSSLLSEEIVESVVNEENSQEGQQEPSKTSEEINENWELVKKEDEVGTDNSKQEDNEEDIEETESISINKVVDIWGLLWSRDAPEDDRTRWYRQGFVFCEDDPSFGLQQGDGGPCGVLAVVQAEILRCLLFGSRADNDIDEILVQGKNKTDDSEIPSPSEFELQIMLGEAFLTILNRVRQQGQPIVIVKSNQLPCNFENMNTSHSSESADDNGNNKSSFSIAKFDEPGDEARCFLASILPQFTSPCGVVLFVMSVILTRGLDQIRDDMDDNSSPLIGQFGHCSQELMNVLLSGVASSNVFDGSVPMGDSGLTLRGISARNPVGYLSHLESLRYCQVGSYLKTPLDPVWVIGSSSHFTVLFSQHRSAISESTSEVLFTAISRAFKSFDPDENGFIPKESLSPLLNSLAQSSDLLQADILTPESISALSASIETAGANIILWDDLWRVVSRLMSGATLEAVLQSHNHSSSGSSGTQAAQVVDVTPAPTTPPSTNNRPRTDSEELAAAIAASLGQDAPTAPTPTEPPRSEPEVIDVTEEQTEEQQMALAIAASLGNVDQPVQAPALSNIATPMPRTQPVVQNRPRTDSEELAAAIAASLGQGEENQTPSNETGASEQIPPPSQGLNRQDSTADENGEKITLYHYNGMRRSGAGGPPRLVKFTINKRGDQEMVGVAVPLSASGGTGSVGIGSDYAIEDVLRTRWPGARINWAGQTPPSID